MWEEWCFCQLLFEIKLKITILVRTAKLSEIGWKLQYRNCWIEVQCVMLRRCCSRKGTCLYTLLYFFQWKGKIHYFHKNCDTYHNHNKCQNNHSMINFKLINLSDKCGRKWSANRNIKGTTGNDQKLKTPSMIPWIKRWRNLLSSIDQDFEIGTSLSSCF